uniref:Serpin domain-containing protein n=1 Tax=Leersia perrieri TaxID=77586 RepID=A0A0D9VWC6_9ORYZ
MAAPIALAHQTSFGLRLAAALTSPTQPQGGAGRRNVAFSPLSLHVALSLVAAGAGGATHEQLASVLGGHAGSAGDLHALAEQLVQVVLSDASGAGGPRLAFANGVFVDASMPLKRSFRDVAVGRYKAEAHSVDFQHKAAEVTNQVNSWVEKATSGLIDQILPLGSVDNNTRLVLGNALYFKGAWAQKFDTSRTKDGEFHLLDGNSVQAPFMSTSKKQYLSSYDNVKVLKLPYHQGGDKRQFSMYILLPEAQDGLWSLAEKLNSEPEFLEKHIPTRQVAVGEFKLPKFKISFEFEASDLLKGLGLHLPFSSEANLTEMVNSPMGQNLFISAVFHKSFVEVNEEGTEAAAASGTASGLSAPIPVDFVADHPFLFLIREDKTGALLFVGHVVNPLLAA